MPGCFLPGCFFSRSRCSFSRSRSRSRCSRCFCACSFWNSRRVIGQRRGRLAAFAADAVLVAPQLAVEEVADRVEVRDLDDVVELVGVLVDVVELLLAVRPGDVLVRAEADSLVVERRCEERGVRLAALPARSARDAGLRLLRVGAAVAAGHAAVAFAGRGDRAVGFDVVGLHEGLEDDRAAGARFGVAQEGHHRAAVDALVGFDARQVEDGRRDVDVGGQLAGLRAGLDPGPADQEGQMGGRLVGEELAADQPVLAEEEAVVGGEEDVGVLQPVRLRRACRRSP